MVLEFFCGIVVTCEDIVVRIVTLRSAVEAMVEVVTAVCEEGEDIQKINSRC